MYNMGNDASNPGPVDNSGLFVGKLITSFMYMYVYMYMYVWIPFN